MGAIGPAAATHQTRLVNETFFFAGQTDDQLNKLGGLAAVGDLDPSAPTFTQDAPGDGDPVYQTTHTAGRLGPFGGTERAGNAFSLYWVGPFSGEVNGIMTIDLALAAQAAAIHQSNFDIRVWGDPDLAAGTGTLLGQAGPVPRDVRPGEPVPFTFDLMVMGKVSEQILVQIIPRQQSSDGTIAAYGNAAYPSGFVLPTRVPIEH
jgi:hypothetical protein